jgi:hypothetical protein
MMRAGVVGNHLESGKKTCYLTQRVGPRNVGAPGAGLLGVSHMGSRLTKP